MKQKSSAFEQQLKLKKYYNFHARFYDQTRWSFLFGRRQLIQNLPDLPPHPRILEVGCGTGKNIELLEYLFPDARIFGVDLSESMLDKARKKFDNRQVSLIRKAYGKSALELEPFDIILFSYSLSMLGDDIDAALQQACKDLKPGGFIAAVDFHQTPFRWFQSWMSRNHVAMDGRLPALLRKYFRADQCTIEKAYLGFWQYFHFMGTSK